MFSISRSLQAFTTAGSCTCIVPEQSSSPRFILSQSAMQRWILLVIYLPGPDDSHSEQTTEGLMGMYSCRVLTDIVEVGNGSINALFVLYVELGVIPI